MTHPFIIDATTARTLSYGQLTTILLGPQVVHRPWCRPADLTDGCICLAAALAVDRDITLVDPDFSRPELEALRIAENGLERTETVPATHRAGSLGELLEQVRTTCRSRITLFTSGSTGLPRSVSHPLTNLCRALRVDDKHGADVWGFAYNPTHIAGVQVFLQALFNQNTLVNLFRLPRGQVLDLIEAHGITHISATPTFYRLLLPADRPQPQVRAVTLGGERTDSALLDRLRPLFPNARFRNLYASTEAGTLLASENDVFSIPQELEHLVELRDGRLHLHASLLGEFGSDVPPGGGWYDTGDVVEVVGGNPGRFRIVSRKRDWVNVGGNKVNPAEVEAVLQAHPQVRAARVFGRASSVLGAVLCAEVVAASPAPEEVELRQYLADRLQGFKVPRLIRFVDRIDLTRTGKMQRNES